MHCGPKKCFMKMRVRGRCTDYSAYQMQLLVSLGQAVNPWVTLEQYKDVFSSSSSWIAVLIHCNPEINISYRQKNEREWKMLIRMFWGLINICKALWASLMKEAIEDNFLLLLLISFLLNSLRQSMNCWTHMLHQLLYCALYKCLLQNALW